MFSKIRAAMIWGFLERFLGVHYVLYFGITALAAVLFYYFLFVQAFPSEHALSFMVLSVPLWWASRESQALMWENIQGNLDVRFLKPFPLFFQYFFEGLLYEMFEYFVSVSLMCLVFQHVPPYWFYLPVTFLLAYTAGFFLYLIPAALTFWLGDTTPLFSTLNALGYIAVLLPLPLLPSNVSTFLSFNPTTLVVTYPVELSVSGYVSPLYFVAVLCLVTVSSLLYWKGRKRYVVFGG